MKLIAITSNVVCSIFETKLAMITAAPIRDAELRRGAFGRIEAIDDRPPRVARRNVSLAPVDRVPLRYLGPR